MQEKIFLDPLNDYVTSSSFAAERQAVADKINHYIKHPFEVKVLFAICCAAPIFVIGVFAGLHYVNYFVIVISFVGLVLFYFYMRGLQEEVILLLLCEKKGWVYNPDPDYGRANKLAHLFPDVFNRGDRELRKVDNQIWGTFGKEDKCSFWSCMFHFEQQDSRYDIQGDAYDKPVFVFELPVILPVHFSLFSNGLHTDVKTESIEFNNKYRIILQDKGKHAHASVVKILSPSVIVRLMEFADTYAVDCISFNHNCMVVLFNTQVWKAQYTNFVNRVAIDERDTKNFDHLLEQLTELTQTIRQYMK